MKHIKRDYSLKAWVQVCWVDLGGRAEAKIKGDSNPNNKYVLSERALWTMNFDTSIIKIGWKMGKLWAFKKFNMANI